MGLHQVRDVSSNCNDKEQFSGKNRFESTKDDLRESSSFAYSLVLSREFLNTTASQEVSLKCLIQIHEICPVFSVLSHLLSRYKSRAS